jgi:hypothetical protein
MALDLLSRGTAIRHGAVLVSVPVVKTRVHRARLFLRRQLGEFMATSDDMAVASAV